VKNVLTTINAAVPDTRPHTAVSVDSYLVLTSASVVVVTVPDDISRR